MKITKKMLPNGLMEQKVEVSEDEKKMWGMVTDEDRASWPYGEQPKNYGIPSGIPDLISLLTKRIEQLELQVQQLMAGKR